jgi:hypothetical protein
MRSGGEDVGRRRRITLAGQDVEHDICGMNAVSDRLGAGYFNGRQAVGQNRVEDVDHLTIAIVGTDSGVAGVIAYYPLCYDGVDPMVRTLVLIGEKDDWTPAAKCQAVTGKTNFEVVVF